ncbi:MAG: DUF935 domain-containing protein [Pseudomonadota bacterium]
MDILDQFGRPIERPEDEILEEELAAPSLGSVRQVAGGHPADGLTPQRLAGILRSAELSDATPYLELAEQMEEKDNHYGAVLGVRKRAIRKLTLQVTAASDEAPDIEAAALVRRTLERPGFRLILSDMLDGLGKGYSVIELIWRLAEGGWNIVGFKHRDPRWFRYDPEDGTTLLLRDLGGDTPLPYGKFAVHEPKLKSGIPIRAGLARAAAWAYIFKNFSIKDWQIFLETYGHPVRLGKYGPNASTEDRRTLLRALKMIGTDLAGIIPKSMDVELVTAAVNQADKLFEGNAVFWNLEISKRVLGQTGTTDAIAGGHAVGRIHNEVREDIRDADAEQLAMTIMEQIAAPLVQFNLLGATPPIISFEAPEDHDPQVVLNAIERLGPKGLTVPVRHVREVFGIREPEEHEEVLSFAAPASAVPADPTPAPGVARTASAQAGLPDAVESAIDSLMSAQAEGATGGFLGALAEAIEGAGSLEEMRDILASLADTAPDAEFVGLLDRLTLIARLSGEMGGELT